MKKRTNENSAYELSKIQELEESENVTIVGGYNFENWACENCTSLSYKVGDGFAVHTAVINWKTDSIERIEP